MMPYGCKCSKYEIHHFMHKIALAACRENSGGLCYFMLYIVYVLASLRKAIDVCYTADSKKPSERISFAHEPHVSHVRKLYMRGTGHALKSDIIMSPNICTISHGQGNI
jgi:hypothetical protein